MKESWLLMYECKIRELEEEEIGIKILFLEFPPTGNI